MPLEDVLYKMRFGDKMSMTQELLTGKTRLV